MRLSAAGHVVALAALAGACGPAPLVIEEGCSPLLAAVDCGLPYPSDFFLVDDPAMPSGKRVQIPERARLITSAGLSGDLHEVWAADGFSRIQPIVVSFGVRVDPASVPGIFSDPTSTTKRGFPTAIIDAETGERVAHFVDVDPRAVEDAREALVLNPLVPLRARARYVVAISGVKSLQGGAEGALVSAPEAFRRLRDKDVGADPVLEPLLARYEAEIFPVLEGDGLARADLQLAWDFTTGSDEHVLDDMLTARAAGLAALETTDPVVEIEAVIEGDILELTLDGDASDTWRLIKGFMTGPRVVDSDDAGALLSRDASGKVVLDGTTRFPFTAIVPASVRDSTAPAPLMLFGHGFFGDRGELEGTAARGIANTSGAIAIAIDWQGMSIDDIGEVVETVGGDVSRSILFGERVMQAMVNWHTVTRALELGLLGREPAFRRPSAFPTGPVVIESQRRPDASNANAPLIDPGAPVGFVGISQGHLLGGTLSALNPRIERSVLLVGGGALGVMMFRARPFTRFLFLLDLSMPDPLDQRKLAAMMQSQFDRFDPVTFGQFVLRKDLPLGPTNNFRRRQVLEIAGIGDTQVPNLASEIHARAMGLSQLTPAPQPALFGMSQHALPVEGSGYAVYDLGVDPSFYASAEPAEDGNVVHEGVRRVPQVLEQIRVFLREGTIIDACGGPCVVDVSGQDIPE